MKSPWVIEDLYYEWEHQIRVCEEAQKLLEAYERLPSAIKWLSKGFQSLGLDVLTSYRRPCQEHCSHPVLDQVSFNPHLKELFLGIYRNETSPRFGIFSDWILANSVYLLPVFITICAPAVFGLSKSLGRNPDSKEEFKVESEGLGQEFETTEDESKDGAKEVPTTPVANSEDDPCSRKDQERSEWNEEEEEEDLPFSTWDINAKVKIRDADKDLIGVKTIPEFIQETVEKYPENAVFCQKEDGVWQSMSFEGFQRKLIEVSKVFIKFGLRERDVVGLIGFNSTPLMVAQFAAIHINGIAATLPAIWGPEECLTSSKNINASIIVCEGKQIEKLLQIKDQLENLKKIIVYNCEKLPNDPMFISMEEAINLTKEDDDDDVNLRNLNVEANMCCMVIFTSGTGGNSKAVMISHDNIIYQHHLNRIKTGFIDGGERIVSYFPISHIAALLTDIIGAIGTGGTCYFAQPDWMKGSLKETIVYARPTFFVGVPRVYQILANKFKMAEMELPYTKKLIVNWAKKHSLKQKEKGQQLNWIAKKILNKGKEAAGFAETNTFITCGAPMPNEILEYFNSLDMPPQNAYGLSESTGPHLICQKPNKIGSCGPVMYGYRVKLDNQNDDGIGEILLDGRNIAMGYANLQEYTQETFGSDGYLRTGDLGTFDEDGYLYITGREKDIIIGLGGENIAPTPIEDTIKQELPCISNCVVVGDNKPYLGALLTFKTLVDEETLLPINELDPMAKNWCESVGSEATTVQEAIKDKNVTKEINEGISRANARAMSRACVVKAHTILPKDFSITGGELSLTMKVKRKAVMEMYEREIDGLYLEQSLNKVKQEVEIDNKGLGEKDHDHMRERVRAVDEQLGITSLKDQMRNVQIINNKLSNDIEYLQMEHKTIFDDIEKLYEGCKRENEAVKNMQVKLNDECQHQGEMEQDLRTKPTELKNTTQTLLERHEQYLQGIVSQLEFKTKMDVLHQEAKSQNKLLEK